MDLDSFLVSLYVLVDDGNIVVEAPVGESVLKLVYRPLG